MLEAGHRAASPVGSGRERAASYKSAGCRWQSRQWQMPARTWTMTIPSEPQRRFPDAREDLEKTDQVPGTPQTLQPSYRLAFSDADFLTRDELRPVRLQLELLKTEMALAERGIVSTVVMFGSARIPDPAEGAGADARVGAARRLLRGGARVRAALRHPRAGDREPRGGGLHRRRPRDHGGRQPRRGGGGRHLDQPQHRAAARAGAEPLRDPRPQLQLPLLRHPQDAFPDARQGDSGVPRRLRHLRRALRGADARPDRTDAAAADPALRRGVLAAGGQLGRAGRGGDDRCRRTRSSSPTSIPLPVRWS